MNTYLETPEPEQAQEAPEEQAAPTAVELVAELANKGGKAGVWWTLVGKCLHGARDFDEAVRIAGRKYPTAYAAMLAEANQR